VAAGAGFHDRAQVIDFLAATKVVRVFADQIDDFLQKLGTRHDFALAGIHQPLVQSVTLSPPAIFFNQHGRILTPTLIVFLQPVEHAQQAQEQRCYSNGIVQSRTNIGNPHFQGWETVAGANVPSQFSGVLD